VVKTFPSKRGPGRPKKLESERTKPTCVRLYQDDRERLDRLTEDGRSESSVIREALALLEASGGAA
jgi:hypothetical protein